MANEDTVESVSHMSVKLPPCWTQDIELWLFQFEAQFRIRNIQRESTKFDYIIQALPPEVITQLRSLILNPPTNQPYSQLKSELMRLHTLTDKQRYRQIMREESLGDEKPSQFLQRMRHLVGDDKVESAFFKEMFLEKMPSVVQTVLAALSDTNTLAQMAVVADRMMDSCSVPPSISRTSMSTSPPSASGDDSPLARTVRALQQELRELRLELRSRSRSRNRHPSLDRVRSPSPASAGDPELCWYHATFGKSAIRCRPPCKMAGKANASE